MHKGIVLNLEDFGGTVEFNLCTLNGNYIFIPEILNVNHTLSTTYDMTYFENTVTNELEFSACNPVTGVN